MTRNSRRFIATAVLTLTLATTPLVADPSRPRRTDRDRPSIVQIVKRLVQRLIGVGVGISSSSPTGPIPAPSTNSPN